MGKGARDQGGDSVGWQGPLGAVLVVPAGGGDDGGGGEGSGEGEVEVADEGVVATMTN
jgi:hypothetical protein